MLRIARSPVYCLSYLLAGLSLYNGELGKLTGALFVYSAAASANIAIYSFFCNFCRQSDCFLNQTD